MLVARPSAQANGDTWTASPVNDGGSLVAQRRIAAKVANALGGTVSIYK
jgi:hypothetical protein